MKAALLCWFIAGLPLFADTLKFDATTKSVVVTGDEKTITVDFPFTNESDSATVIEKYDVSCSCSGVVIKDSKLIYQPGESGVIQVNFDMALISGTIDKAAAVYLKGDRDGAPSIRLTTHITIPALVEISPKSAIWDVGADPAPKTVTLTMDHSEPIKVISVSGTDSRFKHELKVVEEGKKYEIVITPESTDATGMGVIHVETDCKIQRHRSHRLFAVVRQPVGRTAATP